MADFDIYTSDKYADGRALEAAIAKGEQASEDVKNKVDKVSGKGLSTNDYTTAEKQKLAGLENYDDTDVKEALSAIANNGAKNVLEILDGVYTGSSGNVSVTDGLIVASGVGTATGAINMRMVLEGIAYQANTETKPLSNDYILTADDLVINDNTLLVLRTLSESGGVIRLETFSSTSKTPISLKKGTILKGFAVLAREAHVEIACSCRLMMRNASIKDDTFVPYAPTNRELYEMIKQNKKIYGFHVNSNESDPAAAVTYLKDAVGMTPAYMDYTNQTFNYGSWKDAFFIPHPCMLKTNGRVDYYLNENNYAKKADGTNSDIANVNYDGNAMMEWGREGQRIYYSIVPDANPESYSVYIANYPVDSTYHCWSFYNKDNELLDHFYTPIYSGSLVNDKLRSLSGQTPIENKTGTQEISYAKTNGAGWNIECWSDKLLMYLLLYLMGKSLDIQKTFGQGHTTGGTSGTPASTTGELNTKGLFFGYSTTTQKVKVFGMEDQWGERWNRCNGLMLNNGEYFYKMTEGTIDGSAVGEYPTTATTGMISGGMSPTDNGFAKAFKATGDVILPSNATGSSSTYYCDYFYQNQSEVRLACLGGYSGIDSRCGFGVTLDRAYVSAGWSVGASLCYKQRKNAEFYDTIRSLVPAAQSEEE